MKSSNISELLETFDRCGPASSEVISKAEKELGLKFPEEYVDALKIIDGGEGFVGSSYLILWKVEELKPLNEAYEVQDYVPGLLIFGSDGGGEAYGFDMRTANWQIVRVPFVGIDWSLAKPAGASFKEFLSHLREYQ